MHDKSADVSRCGEAVIEWLEHAGVDTVFGIPGVHTQELYRGLARSGIRHVQTRHEQGAGFMACGYARASGRPGVCVLITGPGVTNATTALGQAYADSLPVFLLSSENARYTLGKGLGELHEISDQAALTRPVTGFNAVADSTEALPDLLTRGFSSFAAGRTRPAHLAIPVDVLAAPLAKPWPVPAPRAASAPAPSPLAPSPDELQAAARMLTAAQQPVICVGGGAVNASAAVVTLAERLNAPVLSSHAGKGVMPASHPLSAGACMHMSGGLQLLAASDCVLAIGTELAWTDTFVDRLPISKLIRIDIDPHHEHARYAHDVMLTADATVTTQALCEVLGNHVSVDRDTTARLRACAASNDADLTPLERKHCHVLQTLRGALPEEAIVCADSTQLTYTAQYAFACDAPRKWLYGAGFCTLGGALPEAIGAALACPDTPVMAMAGDGGFMFTLQELATAVDLSLSLPVLIWNNDALGQIKDGMDASGITPVGVTGTNPDFRLLAAAFGCAYARPDSATALASALHAALTRNTPTLIEVHEHDAWMDHQFSLLS